MPDPPRISGSGLAVPLRILATTDMHMNVLPFNYLTAQASDRLGLARTASLIEARRAEVRNCLLLDNGDFLQGTPMGDYVAQKAEAASHNRDPHPAIAAMNALNYDAASLGNHDFTFGLAYLRQVTAQARFPFLAANLEVLRGKGFAGYVILRRMVTDGRGQQVPLNIGIVGFLPPQTVDWDCDLSAELACDDILASARKIIPEMRMNGAQIIVALAHSGIGSTRPSPRMENAAAALAGVEGIDAIVAGHTHEVFPSQTFAASAGIDPVRGTLLGKPAVMAGFGGSHLGVIDLTLMPRDGGWRVAAFTVRSEAVPANMPASPEIARPVLTTHRATLRHLRRRVGRIESPLNSYFSLIGHDPGLQLVNMAQRWHVRSRLRGTEWEGLPLLSAAAPFRAGGRGGPDYYTDVSAGRLSLRNLADLYTFPNRICAVRISGAQLRGWLERSASLFLPVQPGSKDAPLLDPDFPCYNFDVIDGVTWQIDLSRPARFTADGDLAHPDSQRIVGLRWRGLPVGDEDAFLLATNSFRLSTCGLFSPLVSGNQVALAEGRLTRDILRHYVRIRRRIAVSGAALWSFRPMPGTSVRFETGPRGLTHLADVEGLQSRLELAGHSDDGFARLRLHL
ncbi:bifunctional 2',3'-cyclic-nucleotide 2'-phosphodiesterase/3'-nucleotidase [Paracoccus caeni]|uniref:bifunctional 2',3'-cyclic-nucleotide 2'-phosphodiesterase/3'-nucleotidase n=1 Tax=Paracoccus caeni TaxID=657651 RepID=UPI002D8041EB|nr:bifunctional 2',3'-cyclic-nucleotide 2'-phosphodiesterase/3'-nucleotidase [Paracoccus caeni]